MLLLRACFEQWRPPRWSPHAGASHILQRARFLTRAQWPPIKGLYRDAECVAWALQSLPLSIRPTKTTSTDLSVFVVPALYDADNHTLVKHFLGRDWVPIPSNPKPIAHMTQSRDMSALLSTLPPPPAVAHSVLEWCEACFAPYFSARIHVRVPGAPHFTSLSSSRPPSLTLQICARGWLLRQGARGPISATFSL